MFLAALGLNLAGFAFHLTALRLIPLFLAQSGIAASLAVTAILAVRVFHDPLGSRDWTAVIGVCVGLSLMATSAGDVGDESASTAFQIGLFAGVVLIAAGAAVLVRVTGVLATAGLGFLAGLGFAGVGICARVLPDLKPATIIAEPTTYALLLSGALAFLLYSLSLQRGSVTGATAPMIVSQTVTPAAVGVFLLNDGVRTGWWPIALVGFVITGASAIALARFEGAPDHHA